jgi:hypothetical protein
VRGKAQALAALTPLKRLGGLQFRYGRSENKHFLPLPRLKPLFLRHAAFSLVNADIISCSQTFASQYSTNLCVELVWFCSDVGLCPMVSAEPLSHYCLSHCAHKCTEGLGLSERLLLHVNSCMLVDIC